MAKHQIAVVIIDEVYSGMDDWEQVIRSITEWSEVDNEERELLRAYTRKNGHTSNGKMHLIERKDKVENDFVRLTLENIREEASKEAEKAEEAKRKREETKRKKELAKLAADEAAEKELLKQLQEKYKE